jgi:hypothetical protein
MRTGVPGLALILQPGRYGLAEQTQPNVRGYSTTTVTTLGSSATTIATIGSSTASVQ